MFAVHQAVRALCHDIAVAPWTAPRNDRFGSTQPATHPSSRLCNRALCYDTTDVSPTWILPVAGDVHGRNSTLPPCQLDICTSGTSPDSITLLHPGSRKFTGGLQPRTCRPAVPIPLLCYHASLKLSCFRFWCGGGRVPSLASLMDHSTLTRPSSSPFGTQLSLRRKAMWRTANNMRQVDV